MLKIILYLAVSADGFIADKDGGVAWLEAYGASGETYGYEAFYNSIDALAIGKNTYEQILTFGAWPYAGKTSYIFAGLRPADISNNILRSPNMSQFSDTAALEPANKDIVFVDTDIPEFMHAVIKTDVTTLWLVGGAQLAASFYKNGLIDEYIISVMPTYLEQGIPLLPEILSAQDMTLVNEKAWPHGVVQRHYKKSNSYETEKL